MSWPKNMIGGNNGLNENQIISNENQWFLNRFQMVFKYFLTMILNI